MNLANKLTIMRIILVPIFLIFIMILKPYGTIIATLVFIIASITDKLDGYIARSRNQITKFGKFMDPLADKLLVTAALVTLVEFHTIPALAAIIIIAREFAVTGLRTLAASEGIVIAASKWGKLKTVFQIIAIILCLLKVNIDNISELSAFILKYNLYNSLIIFINVTLWIAIIITLISGFDYFIKNKEVLKPEK